MKLDVQHTPENADWLLDDLQQVFSKWTSRVADKVKEDIDCPFLKQFQPVSTVKLQAGHVGQGNTIHMVSNSNTVTRC